MLKLAAVLALSLWPAAAAEGPGRTVAYDRGFGNSLPIYDNGYLFFITGPNSIEVWGPDGTLHFQTELTTPPGAHIMSAAVDGSGLIAVGVALSAAPYGYQGGIAFIDGSGKELRFVETGRYMPAHVCFDTNHALWTFGWQRDLVRNESEDTEDYFLFRKYSLDGNQLGAYVQRSLFPRPGLAPGAASGGFWRLRASGGRIGAVGYSGRTSGNLDWIEVGLDGNLVGKWKIGRYSGGGMAFTAKSGLCRRSFQEEHPVIQCFDRMAQAWKTLGNMFANAEDPRLLGFLLGADGDDLVFGSKESGGLRLSWVGLPGN
jgi:hypothetical protein